jgi:hypothetical protein
MEWVSDAPNPTTNNRDNRVGNTARLNTAAGSSGIHKASRSSHLKAYKTLERCMAAQEGREQ